MMYNSIKHPQVMVMTSQILVDMLNHNFVPLERINLLVFDECHHGVDDHPMRQIMKATERVPKRLHPKIIGNSSTFNWVRYTDYHRLEVTVR